MKEKRGAVTGEREGRQEENLFGVVATICGNYGPGRRERERKHVYKSSGWFAREVEEIQQRAETIIKTAGQEPRRS